MSGNAKNGKLKPKFFTVDEIALDATGKEFKTGKQIYNVEIESIPPAKKEALESCLKSSSRSIIAVGGSLVLRPDSYNLLLSKCETIWLKASPEEHMERVIRQGDNRPMSSSVNAMTDLKNILESRIGLYEQADHTINTSETTVDESVKFISIKQNVVPH